MVKIDRCPVEPPSLSLERKKAYGSYNEPDVVRQLKEDSYNKCYICELKGLTDPEVEHLYPHYNRRLLDRVFDWNNLFYVCPHCNKIKKQSKYNEKIIDCCAVDPEEFLNQVYEEGHVKVDSKIDGENAIKTAELIQECFEKRNTGIREAACQQRVELLADEMNALYKTLSNHKKYPECEKYTKGLRYSLSRESAFAGFKRDYVKKHILDYEDLGEFLA